MNDRFALSLGGLIIEVRVDDGLRFLFDDPLPAFRIPLRRPDIRWLFREIPEASLRAVPDGSGWLDIPEAQTLAARGSRHRDWLASECHQGAFSCLDFLSNEAHFFFRPGYAKAFGSRGIAPVLLAPFLPSFDAVMLHASAVVRDGRTALFLAADEGGKTTAARLAPTGTILGDDQVIVRRRRGRFQAWGTPWGLHVNATEHAPLAGLFLLKKAKRFSLTPLPDHRLVPFIWEEIKGALSILPKPLKIKAFNILCDIAAAAPAWTLAFPRDHINWQEVDLALQGRMKNTGQRED